MATVRNYWNDTSAPGAPISCNGAGPFSLSDANAAAALGLAPGTPIRFNAKDEFGGYNQVTVVVRSLGGGRTWGLQANVGGAWITLATGLATDVCSVTHGIGPQAGVHEPGATPPFRALPEYRATDYRVTVSGADVTGKIHFTAEAFSC